MKLQVIDNDVKYWVVRAGEDAKYYEHFRNNGVVALGHIDGLDVADGIIEGIQVSDLTAVLTELYGRDPEAENEANGTAEGEAEAGIQSASQIGSSVTQASTFINDIKIGDIIITVNKKRVLLGTIKSKAYIESGNLRFIKQDGNFHSRELKYKLRRKVEWETAKLRASIPSPIRPSLNAHQTLFSISEKNQELFTHWLYGIFQQNDRLYFSTKIDERDKISQFNVTEFQRAIQKIELLAEMIETDNLEINDNLSATIDAQYLLSGMDGDFTLTTKNSFLSPGNIWNEVGGSEAKRVIFAMILGLLFNYQVEASDNVEITDKQEAAILIAANSLKEDGNFEHLRVSIKATLDSPNKSLRAVPTDNLEGKDVIVFPRVNEEGDTGI